MPDLAPGEERDRDSDDDRDQQRDPAADSALRVLLELVEGHERPVQAVDPERDDENQDSEADPARLPKRSVVAHSISSRIDDRPTQPRAAWGVNPPSPWKPSGYLERMGVGEERRGAAWRFVRAAARSQSGGVAGAVSSGLLWQLGAVAAPLIVGTAIDHGIVTSDRHTLLLWLVALLGLGLLEVSAGGMRHIYAIRNRSRSDAQVRDAIFAHALRLDASYHDRVGPGELLSRASSDSLHVARMMDAIGHTIGYALTVVAVAIVMLVLDVQLALIVLIPLPFVSLGAWLYSRRYDAGTRKLQESLGRGVDARRGDGQRDPGREGARRRAMRSRPASAGAATRSYDRALGARAARRGLQPGARDAAAARDRGRCSGSAGGR